MPDELRAAIILHVPPKTVEIEVGLSGVEFRRVRTDRLDDERVPHLRRLLIRKEAFVASRNLAVAELSQQPPGHVVGADRKAARGRAILGNGRTFVERLLGAQADNRPVGAAVRMRSVRVGVILRVRYGRMIHPKRRKDVVADILLPRLPTDLLDQLAGRHVKDVVVGIAAAETRRGFEVADSPHRLLARKIAVGNEQQVALAEAQPAAVNEQVADRHLARDPRVPHAKIRHVVDHFVVPLDLALVDERRQRGDGKRLAGRTGEEDRVRADRLIGADLAHAPAMGESHLAVFDDGDRNAGDAICGAKLLDASLKSGRRRGANRRRENGRGDSERQMHMLQDSITPATRWEKRGVVRVRTERVASATVSKRRS